MGVKWLILLPIVRKLHLIGLNNENENKPKAKSKTKQNWTNNQKQTERTGFSN